MYVAAILGNFFEAGWAIQVLIGDMDRVQYFRSRLTRWEIERNLRIMVDSAQALPAEARAQMPKVAWADWSGLGGALDCATPARRDAVWRAISEWLPITGHHLNQYRRQLPALFSFTPAG